MTHLKYPVLASLALLGACNYEVTLWSSGGGSDGAFDATKIGDLVKQVAHQRLGEPTAIRCPPKMQFVPRDHYTCQFDFASATYDVEVRHSALGMNAVAHMVEPVLGFEPLSDAIEASFPRQEIEADCTGVVVSRSTPTVVCPLTADERVAVVHLVDDELSFMLVKWGGWPG